MNWHAPETERRTAIEWMVAHPDRIDLAMLILPSGAKGLWDGCAEVVTRIGSPRIDPYLPALLVWFQDLNWPGGGLVFEFLERMDRDRLLPAFKAVVEQARAERDPQWEYFLARLADERGDLRAACEPWTAFDD